MEMKYLKEQDSDEKYFPVVHVDGVIGLDAAQEKTVSVYKLNLANKEQGIDGGTLTIYICDKMVYADIDIEIDSTTENDEFLYRKLLDGGDVIVDVEDIFDCPSMGILVFNTISYDETNTMSPYIDTSISLLGRTLSVRSSLKYTKLTLNEDMFNIDTTEDNIKLSKVVGSAYGVLVEE